METPFQQWLKSHNGKKCANFSSLKTKEFLENRLYHAYSAGMIDEYNRNKQMQHTLQSTIEWYEERKRESDHLIKELRSKIEILEKQEH